MNTYTIRVVALAAAMVACVSARAIEPCHNPNFYLLEDIQVIDGDTVDADIYLGLDTWLQDQRIRLAGLDAPETRTRDSNEKARGQATKDWLGAMLLVPQTGQILLAIDETKARGKFGRILGVFLVHSGDGEWINLNQEMIDQQLANPYEGRSR